MKTFKDIKAFEKRIQHGPDWDDYFTLGGKLYTIIEYGDSENASYVYFLNKRTGNMVRVGYDCPSYQWIDGKRVQTKAYALHEVELQDWNPTQWR